MVERVLSPWFCLSTQWRSIRQLHPASAAMLRLAVQDAIANATAVFIFPDGSGGSASGCASWAFCVICQYADSTHSLHGFTAGRMTIDPGDAHYVGADHFSSFTSEMVSFMLSLAWLVQATNTIPKDVPVFIGYENQPVADIAMGFASSALAPGLTKLLTGMWQAANSFYNILPFHIHSHNGHPWNEMADSICTDIGMDPIAAWVPSRLIDLRCWANGATSDPAWLFLALLDDIDIKRYPDMSTDRKHMRAGPAWKSYQYPCQPVNSCPVLIVFSVPTMEKKVQTTKLRPTCW